MRLPDDGEYGAGNAATNPSVLLEAIISTIAVVTEEVATSETTHQLERRNCEDKAVVLVLRRTSCPPCPASPGRSRDTPPAGVLDIFFFVIIIVKGGPSLVVEDG